MIDTSLRIAANDAETLQPLRPQARNDDAVRADRGAGEQDVRVSISPEARAAEQTARIAGPDQGALTQEVAGPASAIPVQPPAAPTRTDAAASPVAVPAAQAETARAEGIATSSAAPADTPRRREPDAPTAEGNQAVQMYLENATRPENRPMPSAIRDSA